jgi:alpha-L-rhamnosidase
MLGSQNISVVEVKGAARKGQVRWVKTMDEAIAAVGEMTEPNLRFIGSAETVFFLQKRIGPLELYFLRNSSPEERDFEVKFPVGGASPEVWDPWTGEISPLLEFQPRAKDVQIKLNLPPYGSKLIVFDPEIKHSPRRESPRPGGEILPPLTLGSKGNSWTLHAIGKELDGKEQIFDLELTDLVDWSKHAQLRHFSGKGRYTIRFNLDPSYLKQNIRLELDLGEVRDVAEIVLNGKKGITLLLRPYRADVTPWLQPGENRLEVTVTNTLLNHLVGAGMKKAVPFGGIAQEPQLLPSGLLGPVRLLAYQR